MTAPAPQALCSGCGKTMVKWWYDDVGRAYCIVCARTRHIVR